MQLHIILSQLGRPVAYYPKVAKFLGSVSAAIFLCQFAYWAGKEKNRGEIFKTAKEIEEETGLSLKQQKTVRKVLKTKRYLREEIKGIPPVVHYIFDWQKITEDWNKFLREEDQGSSESEAPNPDNDRVSSGSETPSPDNDQNSPDLEDPIPDNDQDSPDSDGSNKFGQKGQTSLYQRDKLIWPKGTNYTIDYYIDYTENTYNKKGQTEKTKNSQFKDIGRVTFFTCPWCKRKYPEKLAVKISPQDFICVDCYITKRKLSEKSKKMKTLKPSNLSVDLKKNFEYKQKTGGGIVSYRERSKIEEEISKIERMLKNKRFFFNGFLSQC